MFVMIVKDKTGTLSRFVRRIEADDAFIADLRARWRGGRGSSRLMVLSSAAD